MNEALGRKGSQLNKDTIAEIRETDVSTVRSKDHGAMRYAAKNVYDSKPRPDHNAVSRAYQKALRRSSNKMRRISSSYDEELKNSMKHQRVLG
jgi:hypothetical protein